MALYNWECEKCGLFNRVLADKRPVLIECTDCGGKLRFVSKIGSYVSETFDNGLMVKKIERPANVEQLIKDRNELAEKSNEHEII